MAENKYHSFDKSIPNPFETIDNSKQLMNNLAIIDSRDLRTKFKATEDPITIAFATFEDAPLKTLAKDFIKEGLIDFISLVKEIVK